MCVYVCVKNICMYTCDMHMYIHIYIIIFIYYDIYIMVRIDAENANGHKNKTHS